jgi:hypothetical protein
MHKAAMSDTAKVLLLQSALDAHDSMQTDLPGHEAEEASWSVLRIELTRQAERTRHLEEGARSMAELSALCEHLVVIEVLREENRAL